jgi:hypothetical protein
MQEEHNGAELRELGGKWMEKIRTAEKRDENWRKDAQKAEDTYSMDGEGQNQPDFNILYSNVETIVPAIYNSTPVPDIRPKWDRERPEVQGPDGQMVSMPDPYADVANMLERAVTVQIDDNALDTEVEGAAQDSFIAGRGIIRLRMDVDVEDFIEEVVTADEMTGEETVEQVEMQTVKNERVLYEVVPWRDYLEGPASRFGDLPWMAFRHSITQEQMSDYDDDMIKSQATDAQLEPDEDEMTVWEIWCLSDRTVKFIRDDGLIMKVADDPLGLAQFWPVPKPVQPICLTGKRTPINPYKVYSKLAEELDTISRRINAIVSGLKLRGAVVGDMKDIEALSEAGDNTLIPINNVEGLAQTGGLDKAIVWWPVDQAIKVLKELYLAREQTKQAIYEITGISDIVRGASQAAETATAQNIKTQWGSLRINKMQRLIERMVRDVFVLTSEIISKNFSPERMKEITGMEITEEMMQIMDGGVEQYKVDVESDSTVRADLTRQKGEMAEFLRGTAEFFNTMSGVVMQAPQMAVPVVDLYSAFARQFNLGKQAEQAVEMMGQIAKQAQQGNGDDAAQQAAAQEVQYKLAALQADVQLKQADLELKREQGQVDAQLKQAELALKTAELKLKEADLVIKAEQAEEEIDIEREQKRAVKVGNE